MRQKVSKSLDYAKNAVPVVPGTYTCVFSPETAGVFAHESFGHKSEADLMLGSEAMMQEWAIGTQVGSPHSEHPGFWPARGLRLCALRRRGHPTRPHT